MVCFSLQDADEDAPGMELLSTTLVDLSDSYPLLRKWNNPRYRDKMFNPRFSEAYRDTSALTIMNRCT